MFVDAPRFDYSDTMALVRRLKARSRVGHAWVRVQGVSEKGELVELTGGHTGEFGLSQPRYMDGVMDLWEAGDANPIKYLWVTLYDGIFQEGDGGHRASYRARVNLTKESFEALYAFINEGGYSFSEYSLTRNQCSSFVAQVAALAGIPLKHQVTLPVNREVKIGGMRFRLWSDPKYAEITFSSPDVLEQSLKSLVREGNAVRL